MTSTARPLLLFYAGWNYDTRTRSPILSRSLSRARALFLTRTLARWNYDTRMALVRRFKDDAHMLVREKVPAALTLTLTLTLALALTLTLALALA